MKVVQQGFDVWPHLAYIVGLQVEITNTTDNVIRLSSIGIGSDWGRSPPPGDLPDIDDSERQDLKQEVDTRRTDRHTPELPSHPRCCRTSPSPGGWSPGGLAPGRRYAHPDPQHP